MEFWRGISERAEYKQVGKNERGLNAAVRMFMQHLKKECYLLLDPNYWKSRWKHGKIGFHASDVNPNLVEYWPGESVSKGRVVLVPLCGKSLDMRWLMEQGYRVLGVEVVREACVAFMEEHGMEYKTHRAPGFEVFVGKDIELWCGDFFKLKKNLMPPITAVYDRAALVALPKTARAKYGKKILELTGAGATMLINSFHYDQTEMNGPPFAVTEPEIRNLYGEAGSLELLADDEILFRHERFRKRGLSALREQIWKLVKN